MLRTPGRPRSGLAGGEALAAVVGEDHVSMLPAVLGCVVDGQLGAASRLRADATVLGGPRGLGKMSGACSLHERVLRLFLRHTRRRGFECGGAFRAGPVDAAARD